MISELEHTLGVKLFDLSISGVEPTHSGRALLKSGVAVFDEMRKGLQQSKSSNSRTPANGGLGRALAASECTFKVLPVKTLPPPAPVGFVTVKGRTLTPLAERLLSAPAKSPIRDGESMRPQSGRRHAQLHWFEVLPLGLSPSGSLE